MQQRSIERFSQLAQNGRQVALSAQMVPELRGAGSEETNHLAQARSQRNHPLFEASPRSLQATFFLFGGWRFFRLAGIGLGIEVFFDQRRRHRPVGQAVVRQHADGMAAGQAEETPNVFLLVVIAVGEALVMTMPVDGVMRIHRTRRAFSEPCDCCNGRGRIISLDLTEPAGTDELLPARLATGGEVSMVTSRSASNRQ